MSTHPLNVVPIPTAQAAPVILAVDTSATRPGLAIARGPELLATLLSSRVAPHSRTLFDNLQLLLEQALLEVSDIEVFAVVTGPGSFTGLRVGMAALQGLAAAHRRPLCGLDLFDLQSRALRCAATVLLLVDAGRGELYTGLRRLTSAGEVVKVGHELYGRPEAVIPATLDQLDPADRQTLLITGDGVERAQATLDQLSRHCAVPLTPVVFAAPASPGWQIVTPGGVVAVQLAQAVWQLLRNQPPALLPGCHPFYIRPSDAEINWPK